MNIFKDSLESISREVDIKYNLPRKANKQHQTHYQAFLEVMRDISKVIFYAVCALFSVCLIIYTVWSFKEVGLPYSHWMNMPVFLAGGILGVFSLVAVIVDAEYLKLAYRMEFQEETYGSSRWATVSYLKNKKPLVLYGVDDPTDKIVPLTLFGNKHKIGLPIDVAGQGIICVGPPGSGKTASILIPYAREFGKRGCMLALDPKGEIFNYTRHYYNVAYRLDLINPIYTDFFDLFGSCRRNAEIAAKVSSAVINDPDNPPREPIWQNSAIEMLKLIILHLCESIKYPTPQTILGFLAENLIYDEAPDSTKAAPKKELRLSKVMNLSTNEVARVGWNSNFKTLHENAFESVKFTLTSALNIFVDEKVATSFRPPSLEETKMGRKVINFANLRKLNTVKGQKKGNALYIVIPEGESKRLRKVVTACFQLAIDSLRTSGDDKQEVPCLMLFEEAGNVPPPELPEIVNVGRGRKMHSFICLQNIAQLDCYGTGNAKAVMESVGSTIILPGVKGQNADYATGLAGKTTVFQESTTDAVSNSYDSERISQVQRNLIEPDEVRRMPYHSQLLLFINDFYAIKARFPSNGKVTDNRVAEPRPKASMDWEKIEQRASLDHQFSDGQVIETNDFDDRESDKYSFDDVQLEILEKERKKKEEEENANPSASMESLDLLTVDEDANDILDLSDNDFPVSMSDEIPYQGYTTDDGNEETFS